MAASNPITSIVNPSRPETLIFYVTEKRQLALERWPFDLNNRRKHVDNGTRDGDIATPGVISSVIRQGVITVYGFLTAEQLDSASTDRLRDGGNESDPVPKYIAQLSPVVNPVMFGEEMQTSLYGLATGTDGDTKTWIYFLKSPAVGTNPVLHECEIIEDTPNVNPLLADNQPLANSKLALLKYPKNDDDGSDDRSLYFQDGDNDNKIYQCFPSRDNDNATTLPQSAGLVGTAIAATYSGLGASLVTYVYYLNQNKDLVCSIKKGGINGKWDNPIVVPKSKKVNANSQLTVTTDSKHNHIFYIETGGKSYTELTHPLVK
ncbi:hypothetical protein ABW20_dc0108476 [Dactylellina cionopaga]|nr:hypothetical protein ABW20_dc0108476 [Dactylellina cionopaga]